MGNINIPVLFLPADTDACSFYRMFIPHLSCPGSDYYYTGWSKEGKPNTLDPQRLMGHRVAVVQRQSSIFNLQAMQALHRMGFKVIYDLDDNLWNLPHGNPAKKAFEIYQQGFSMCAAEADVLTVSTRGLRTAASVSLPQKEILVIPNAVDLNMFHRKEIERDDEFVIIGWGGSNTHTFDVKEVFNLLPEILNENKHAGVEIVGAPAMDEVLQEVKIIDLKYKEEKVIGEIDGTEVIKQVPDVYMCLDLTFKREIEVPCSQINRLIKTPVFSKKKKRIEGYKQHEFSHEEMIGRTTKRLILVPSKLAMHGRYRFKPWVPIKEFTNRLASWAWDIAIAPLEENRFNDSKSNIKMLEAAALKIPCLVSGVTPYLEFTALGGEDLKWLVCHSKEDWKKKLTVLVNEPERRTYLGNKMYDVMKKYYCMDEVQHLWRHAFNKALSS